MRALVTGGAGFIGSHLVDRLVARGDDVTVLDALTTGKLENLAASMGRIRFEKGDIRDAPLVERLANGCDVVFHEAAIVSVPYSVAHPKETHSVNLGGTLNVLEAARAAGVRRVVFASSAAIYGDDPSLPKHERMLPSPASPYGLEKLAGEHYLAVWARLFGVETVALRYFNVFGPRQDPSSPYSGVISVFISRARAGQPVTIFGDGGQTRDFVPVKDVVEANVLAATTEGIAHEVVNVGRGEETTLLELVSHVEAATGTRLAVTHEAPREGDIRSSRASIQRARAVLGFDPKTTVKEGLVELARAGA